MKADIHERPQIPKTVPQRIVKHGSGGDVASVEPEP